jgi:hypothetical protein
VPAVTGRQPSRLRRYAAALLATGLALAVGTPLYVAWSDPYLAGYVTAPAVLIMQAAPFATCAAIWLPWHSRPAALSGLILAALLWLATLALALRVVTSGRGGGDMIGLWYALVPLLLTGGVLVGSGVAGVVLALRHRAGRHDR